MNQTDTGDDDINLGMLLLLDVSDQTHREAYGIKELPGIRQLFYFFMGNFFEIPYETITLRGLCSRGIGKIFEVSGDRITLRMIRKV